MILERDRGRKLRHREPHQAYTPARHLLQVPVPLCPCPGPLAPGTPRPVQWVQWATSSRPAPPARGLRNKGLKKSDNFSPQLDLIFFFDAPTAGGRIAGEKQVRQERGGLHGTALHGLPGSRTHARAPLPGIGVYSALTAKLMTARDPSRCSSGPSRPWGP